MTESKTEVMNRNLMKMWHASRRFVLSPEVEKQFHAEWLEKQEQLERDADAEHAAVVKLETDCEALVAEVAQLQSLLKASIAEHQELERSIRLADGNLDDLRRDLLPFTRAFGAKSKTLEKVERALAALRGVW